jgi:PAS domain S-box-containing protein
LAADGVRWFAPEHQAVVRSAFERLLHEGTPYALEVQIVTARGTRRWVRTTGERVSDAQGRPQLVRGILQDIEEEYVAWSRVRAPIVFITPISRTWRRAARSGI